MEGFQPETKAEQRAEWGKNVTVLCKMLRHGERDVERNLTDYGREVTRQQALESGVGALDHDAVKAIGSNALPLNQSGQGRALETADIYAEQLRQNLKPGDDQELVKQFNTRANSLLNYETIVTPAPYNHTQIYNSFLPENFANLSNEEKVRAAKKAQTATVNHLMSLETPEADRYKKEVAGAFAKLVKWYERLATHLKDGSKVILPAGTHGGTMELLLSEALAHKGAAGKEVIGFKNLAEIGGDFDPSEAYNVEIATDEAGEIKPFKVTFDNPARPQNQDMYLDRTTLDQLVSLYEELHPKK